MYALASVDLNVLFESQHTVDAFRDALLENNIIDLAMSYINITGSVPDAVSEFVEANPEMRRVDVADHISRLRYNYQKIKRRPVHGYQVSALASKLVDSGSLPTDLRRKTYIQTRRKLLDQGLAPAQASAFAFEIHESRPPGRPALPVVVFGETTDVCLPNAYLTVNAAGGLTVVDSTQGAYDLPTSPALPTQWMCRVSPDSNEFLVGDDQRCVHVSLTSECDAAMQTPLALPPIVSPTCVDNRWVVWGSRSRPMAFEWRAGGAVMCSTPDARKHLVSSGERLRSEGNRITLGCETLAALPVEQSISCIYGDAGVADAITTSRDFWRINIRANRASCVGLPSEPTITAMAPLVGWV